jgi:hypothetical protein
MYKLSVNNTTNQNTDYGELGEQPALNIFDCKKPNNKKDNPNNIINQRNAKKWEQTIFFLLP